MNYNFYSIIIYFKTGIFFLLLEEKNKWQPNSCKCFYVPDFNIFVIRTYCGHFLHTYIYILL